MHRFFRRIYIETNFAGRMGDFVANEVPCIGGLVLQLC